MSITSLQGTRQKRAPLSWVVIPPGDFYDFFECSFESSDKRVVSIVNLRNFVRQMCSIMCLSNVV